MLSEGEMRIRRRLRVSTAKDERSSTYTARFASYKPNSTCLLAVGPEALWMMESLLPSRGLGKTLENAAK